MERRVEMGTTTEKVSRDWLRGPREAGHLYEVAQADVWRQDRVGRELQDVSNAMDGPAISEEEHEVVLQEETPVVQKEVVPKERVRLDVDTHTEERQVSEDVRSEQIEVDGDDVTRRS